jgi:hypothetical protein
VRITIVLATLVSVVGVARADQCQDAADAKKLSGAAATANIAKCRREQPTCADEAKTKKLAGAALDAFFKKCAGTAVENCLADKGNGALPDMVKCSVDRIGKPS